MKRVVAGREGPVNARQTHRAGSGWRWPIESRRLYSQRQRLRCWARRYWPELLEKLA